MRPRMPALPLILLAATLSLAACTGGDPTGRGDPGSSEPAPTIVIPIETPEGAVAAVVAQEPMFAGIGPLDPDLIGQSAWYEVTPASGVGAFLVMFRVGWGDCIAGCIDEHRWVYAVTPDGTVTLQSEEGPSPPDDAWPSPMEDVQPVPPAS